MKGRIVVKIGSQVLCDPRGELNLAVLAQLAGQIAGLAADGWQVLVVSSGAVAAGHGVAGEAIHRVSDPVARKQVLAATGQVRLMENYRALFHAHGLTVAQVLTSKSDFQTRRHYLNMRGCIDGLLAAGIIPVINENDVVSITELMFTDNDELAGLLAGMVNADLLCLLSTVDGVFEQGRSDTFALVGLSAADKQQVVMGLLGMLALEQCALAGKPQQRRRPLLQQQFQYQPGQADAGAHIELFARRQPECRSPSLFVQVHQAPRQENIPQ